MPERRMTKRETTPAETTRRTKPIRRKLEQSLRDLDAYLAEPAQLRDSDSDYREALAMIERRLRGH